ncbi:MAG TPA: thioredoxin-like domain-containing protein [Planctomycetaceae bacterium]|nr:thioredoxin-like domain-containing protein [Planctomycetaceae bacterium]
MRSLRCFSQSLIAGVLLPMLFSFASPHAFAQENPFPNRVPAPSLDGGTEWLNTSGEITLGDLRGKVVLLDFWTYCCINCLHVLPDLKYLEQKYDKELVVIGVHSAKFENEKDSENIREAIVRYEIEHPVINDSEMRIWRKFQVRSWPTMVLIDPEGNFCGSISGEGHRELLDTVIGKVAAYHRRKGTLDETPVRFDLERYKSEPTPLKYPSKLLADEDNHRLFISDSNNNRIVITTLDGELIDIIGNGQMGLADGSYQEAMFDHPHGMELVDRILYVADTENHAIRKIDLEQKTVATLAGTGEQARTRSPGGSIKSLPLNSPWALTHVDGTLFIAMAGPHQIWSHVLGSNRIQVFSGTGHEDIIDGPHNQAAFAQTSGMATDGKFLYVCDSEGSSIRQVPVDPKGKVTTLVGAHDLPQARSLFEFGDIDGQGERARLQHPLGIAYRDGTLFVADTYNHKIKLIDIGKRTSKTWLGDGKRGDDLDPVRFSEPSGLALAGNRLFIADTNNHRVLVADIESKKIALFEVNGLKPPEKPKVVVNAEPGNLKDIVDVPAAIFDTSATSIEFGVSLTFPDGFKRNAEFPMTWRVNVEGEQTLIAEETLGVRSEPQIDDAGLVRISVPLKSSEGKATLLVTLSYGYCRDGKGGVCKLGTTTWKVPVSAGAGGKPIALEVVIDK